MDTSQPCRSTVSTTSAVRTIAIVYLVEDKETHVVGDATVSITTAAHPDLQATAAASVAAVRGANESAGAVATATQHAGEHVIVSAATAVATAVRDADSTAFIPAALQGTDELFATDVTEMSASQILLRFLLPQVTSPPSKVSKKLHGTSTWPT